MEDPVDLVVVDRVVLDLELVDQELVMISQDLRHLFLLLMVGVMMVVMAAAVVAHPIVEAVAVVHPKKEHQHQMETMAVEVCNSLQHLEIQLNLLEHLET
tara:strand:+ start:110 stop:409 length:300 start_codon:yes stop_codon:yes gene_type:complete